MSYREVKLESHRQPTMVITTKQAAEYEAKHRRAYEHARGIVERARTTEFSYPLTNEPGTVSAGNELEPDVENDAIKQDWIAARERRHQQEQTLLDERRSRVALEVGSTALHA